MSPPQITFYDIPTRPPTRSWSFNPWRTRLILNFKGLPYTTHWTEYPDIHPTLAALGIPPHPDADPAYTSPALSLPAVGAHPALHLQDSRPIAFELEKRYPEPSLRLDGPALDKLTPGFRLAAESSRPLWMPRVPEVLLGAASAEFFERTRHERLGESLSAYASREAAGDKAFDAATPGFEQVAALLREVPSGPFIEGAEAGYADLVFVAFLRFLSVVNVELFERVVGRWEEFARLYEASKPWLERDGN